MKMHLCDSRHYTYTYRLIILLVLHRNLRQCSLNSMAYVTRNLNNCKPSLAPASGQAPKPVSLTVNAFYRCNKNGNVPLF